MGHRRGHKVMCSIILHVVTEGRPVKVAVVHTTQRNLGKAIAKAEERAVAQIRNASKRK